MRIRIRRILALLLALLALAGCSPAQEAVRGTPGDALRLVTDAPRQEAETPEPSGNPEGTDGAAQKQAEMPEIAENGTYTAPEDVAAYLRAYGRLPDNFITKSEARALGWPGGDLWPYAPGMSIGGDRFGNYEGVLPEGDYRECDVNYAGGKRTAERLIYSEDGRCYYTADHYNSFTEIK